MGRGGASAGIDGALLLVHCGRPIGAALPSHNAISLRNLEKVFLRTYFEKSSVHEARYRSKDDSYLAGGSFVGTPARLVLPTIVVPMLAIGPTYLKPIGSYRTGKLYDYASSELPRMRRKILAAAHPETAPAKTRIGGTQIMMNKTPKNAGPLPPASTKGVLRK